MTDSYYSDYPEDRSIDHDPDIEDWNIQGEKEDRDRQELILQAERDADEYDREQFIAETKEYEARVEGVKEEIQELNTLKEKLLPLFEEIKEKEEFLIEASYHSIWKEDDEYDWGEEPYYGCKTKEEKMAADLQRFYDYEVITPWINQHTPIVKEMEKQEELDEIQRRKAESLIQHKKKFGIEEEDPWRKRMELPDDEIPF